MGLSLARILHLKDMEASFGTLKVFVTTGCRGCKRALEMAERARTTKPELKVEIIDLAKEDNSDPDLVFAVPTYVYAGRPLFLGNPSPLEFQAWLDNLHQEV